jgi:hypothetical protein
MAAGLGFKTFTTGEVLTAADTNGYLMQGILVFASEAARDAAITSPQEGQFAFTKDNNSLWYYDGAAWVASGATGDIEGVTAGTGLTGGGTSGTVTLDFDVANFGGGSYAAGKNAIINGDFFINQRAFTSNTTSGTFNFDRWIQYNTGGSYTLTPQTFTPGAAPVAGYEGRTFLQAITASQSAAGDFAQIAQTIEGVNKYAGNTVTVSFFAKANTGTPKIAVELQQYFGTGGSPSAIVNTVGGTVTLTTSYARYSVTVAVPSISGKTIGTNNNSYLGINLWTSAGSNFNARASSIGIQNFTASIWGVQVEAGSVATAFQTATGTIQGELAACQRYFQRAINGANSNERLTTGQCISTTAAEITYRFPVVMRTSPTFAISSASHFITITNTGGSAGSPGTIGAGILTPNMARVDTSSGANMVGGNATSLQSTSASATMDFSAEL